MKAKIKYRKIKSLTRHAKILYFACTPATQRTWRLINNVETAEIALITLVCLPWT